MDKPNGLDRETLQTRLENYKLIAELNTELFDENLFAKEEVLGKLELAQRYINESHRWEELGDQTQSHGTLINANIIIVEAGAVIECLLYQDTVWEDRNFQQGRI